MKITFEKQETSQISNRNATDKIKESRGNSYQSGKSSRSAAAFFCPEPGTNWMNGTGKSKGKGMAEIQQEAANTDVAVQQNYRTVLANTMSAEDYAKMEEEGFSFSNMDPETAVTIVDKIKAELMKSGKIIAGYTDDLDMDTLAAALGSDTLAAAIHDSFREADLPLTQENVNQVKLAWDMASNLTQPTESGYAYMVENELEPQVWDFYMAQSSGASPKGAEKGQPKFYGEAIEGYYAENAGRKIDSRLQAQIESLLEREGLTVNEENLRTAEALLEQGVPLTGENLARWQELERVQFPVTEDAFAKAAAAAVSEGKNPVYSDLTKRDNIYEKAVEILAYYQESAENAISAGDITARRQLEEVRLRMSAEVNIKLIQSGFAIDTAPMEELLEALRKAEQEVAGNYFPGDDNAVAKYEQYRNVNAVVNDLPTLPAQILGTFSAGDRLDTLQAFHTEGKALQNTMASQEAIGKAQQSYETLMTAPRKDLGDNIRKAFANVDDILQDLQVEATDSNRRAVRILGYNRMEVTVENIERVRAADELVQSVVEKMTPASTLKMIRDGKNPLEMNFPELEQYFDSLPEEYESASESYSRFLYGLEQKKEITQQEREAYIGIYRMLHQIDASDGAAVGALVNTGAQVHFSNLLSAVRSGKFKSMDVTVSDELGVTMEVIRKGESISEQIAKGFVKDVKQLLTDVSYSEEAEESYSQMNVEQLRTAAEADAEAVSLLEKAQLPQNAGNLLAAQELSRGAGATFGKWKDRRKEEISNLLEHMSGREEFQESCQSLTEDMDAEVQKESLENADTSMDVRKMQLLHKQLTVAGSLAKREDYIFPMYIGDELAKVHFSLDNSGEDKGHIAIAVHLSEEEQLEAHFWADNGKITGYLSGNTPESVMKLQNAADIFSNSVQENTEKDWEVDILSVTDRQRMNSRQKDTSVNREVSGEEAYREVDNAELYRIAKTFLRAVQK